MTKPIRIQRKRIKGWTMPPNTVSITRPGPWGNPFVVGRDGDAQHCVKLYRLMLIEGPRPLPPPSIAEQITASAWVKNNLSSLRGKNLACFCPLDQPCHADVLLEFANA